MQDLISRDRRKSCGGAACREAKKNRLRSTKQNAVCFDTLKIDFGLLYLEPPPGFERLQHVPGQIQTENLPQKRPVADFIEPP